MITNLSRTTPIDYQCIADNGIPPRDTRTKRILPSSKSPHPFSFLLSDENEFSSDKMNKSSWVKWLNYLHEEIKESFYSSCLFVRFFEHNGRSNDKIIIDSKCVCMHSDRLKTYVNEEDDRTRIWTCVSSFAIHRLWRWWWSFSPSPSPSLYSSAFQPNDYRWLFCRRFSLPWNDNSIISPIIITSSS